MCLQVTTSHGFLSQTVSRKAKKARARMEKDAGRLETIADVGNAADFVRVARDAGTFHSFCSMPTTNMASTMTPVLAETFSMATTEQGGVGFLRNRVGLDHMKWFMCYTRQMVDIDFTALHSTTGGHRLLCS